MKIQTLLAYAIVALTTAILTKAADTAHPAVVQTPIHFDFDAMAKMSGPELQMALKSIADNESAMEGEVQSELRDTRRPQARIAAIYIAGMYRVRGTAAMIAPMIDFPGNVYPGQDPGGGIPRDMYPCAEAIQNLGDSSILPLLDNIAKSDKKSVRDISLSFLQNYQRIFSVKGRLEAEIEYETQAGNTVGVARLKAAEPQLLNPPAN